MQTTDRSTSFVYFLIGLAAAALPGLVAAQTVIDEEIVVTARKIEEDPQDVPISISAFSQNTLQELNIFNTDEIALFTPGLAFNSAFGRQPGSDRPSMRGVTTVINGAANASAVATFVDGIYVGGSTQSTELFNLERVEVLRGPQAAQFGRGTYAGAINYVTRGPSEEFEGDVTASAGQNDEYRVSSWISGPLGDQFGFYAGVGYDNYDGDYTNRKIGDTANTLNQEVGDDIGGQETKSITGKLFWNPSERLSVSAKLGYQETDDDHFPIYLQTRFIQARNNTTGQALLPDPVVPFKLNNCCERVFDAPRAREYYDGNAVKYGPVQLNTDILDQAGTDGIELDRKIFALSVDYDLGWWILDGTTFTSLTGYVDDEIKQGLDTSYGGYEPFRAPSPSFLRGAFNQIDDDSQEDLSQEFRLASSRDQSLRWNGGLYYYRGETKENSDERAFPDDTTGVVVRADQFGAGLDRQRVENKAVFGGLEWDFLEQLTGTIELRYQVDEVKLRTLVQSSNATRLRTQDQETSLLPRYTLTYSWTDDLNIYANVAKGTKPQDINSAIPNLPNGDPDTSKRFVKEEEAWNYELGMKSLWFDGRALFNIAGYFFDITDQQLTQNLVDPNTGVASSFVDSVGETEVWGMEMEGSMLFGDYLTVGFTYAYADSEIKDYINQDQADLRGSDGSTAQNQVLGDVSGNQSPRVPENQFSFRSRYERPFGREGTWFVSADYAWEDSKYAQVHNLIETGERSELRAQIGGTWGPWALTLWGKNLTDDQSAVDIIRYVDGSRTNLTPCPTVNPGAICTASSPSNFPRGFGITLPRKRQFGATVTYKFGGNL